ncbi:MAG: hypothetical protein ABW000_09985 [Actinoplanes sp.]
MTTELPYTRREHRQTRRDAERRRILAQREIKQLQRGVRRSAETVTIVGRARLAELAARGLTELAFRLRTSR